MTANHDTPPRGRHLQEQAVIALRDGRSPLDHAFLVEHDVTLTEAYDLADAMATAIEFLHSWMDMSTGVSRG